MEPRRKRLSAPDRSRMGIRLPSGNGDAVLHKKTPGADSVNFYGHYPYQIEQNYFHDEALETRPGVYRATTLNVGSFAPNPNGLYDMYGNVGEWCFDYYGAYGTASQTNPAGAASGTRRVNRGGGWNDFGKNLRSAYRAAAPQTSRLYNVGIRLVTNADDRIKDTVTTKESRRYGLPRVRRCISFCRNISRKAPRRSKGARRCGEKDAHRVFFVERQYTRRCTGNSKANGLRYDRA